MGTAWRWQLLRQEQCQLPMDDRFVFYSAPSLDVSGSESYYPCRGKMAGRQGMMTKQWFTSGADMI